MQAQRLLWIHFDLNCALQRILCDRDRQKSGEKDYDGKEGTHICIGHRAASVSTMTGVT